MTGGKDYEVGFGRPPKASRFQKGTSGNPTGRIKGSHNYGDAIKAALSEKVTVMQNGRRHKISKWDAACTQLANKAAAGDRHATKQMLELMHSAEARDEARALNSPQSVEERRASDARIMDILGQSNHAANVDCLEAPA